MTDDKKFTPNQQLIIDKFTKYGTSKNLQDDDNLYQEAHKFIADLLNQNSFTKKELEEVLPKLEFNSDLYDILTDDYLYLDEWDENGKQMNRYNVKNKKDNWIVGSELK